MAAEATDFQAWRRLALDPPRARGDPPLSGRVRAEPADFLVEERLGFEPDGGSAHFLLLVEKENANTQFVARELAARIGRPAHEIGFAGLKDRRAVARQWFSLPAVKGKEPAAGLSGEGFTVLAAYPHSRKLRRGALAGNGFRIRIREPRLDSAALAERLARLAAEGFPNYFGVQRFGIDAANLRRVMDWLAGARLPRGREPRGFLMSAARALAFNAVLGRRVADASWNRLLAGEIVNLSGSGSVFAAAVIDDALQQRCSAGDVAPTGPLCGTGGMVPTGVAAMVEAAALEPLAPLPQRLGEAGLAAERRALVVRPAGLQQQVMPDAIELGFELPRGAYATSLLREVMTTAIVD
ncbi:MAG: tRNA pseudouridine(13) synthase TruD [Steroidobacteraceae bacterium]